MQSQVMGNRPALNGALPSVANQHRPRQRHLPTTFERLGLRIKRRFRRFVRRRALLLWLATKPKLDTEPVSSGLRARFDRVRPNQNAALGHALGVAFVMATTLCALVAVLEPTGQSTLPSQLSSSLSKDLHP